MNAEEIRKNINKICKTDEEKYVFMETVLGVSAQLAIFISKNADFLNIPIEVHYAMGLTGANMLALHGDDEKMKLMQKMDFSLTGLTTEEKLLKVVELLIETYGDDIRKMKRKDGQK